MITTSLNIFDATVIGIMVLSCLFAFFRGFVKEVLSLGAWIGAAIVTLYYFPMFAERLESHFKNPMIAAGVGTLGIYITALVGFSMFNMIILKFFKSGSDVGMLDNMFGLLFGAFRGAFIISLGFFLITIVLPEKEYPDWMKASITRPHVEKGAILLAKVAPEYLREISTLQKKMEEHQRNEENAGGDEDETSYSNQASKKLNRLIDSAGNAE